ncbi:RND family efflux transporter MFP subunit [Roseiarcus fermentans]|uniref:RND family efflux transporter MFP subunit n=1 Tax=Roseiarcus fermentans TaxID=1473586 RepID=A0A366F7E0_9HYPH|nr:efflux RND transporter periplasmic adaptor subunit [Roseiarcus fermentans]RBP10558.1 RND family efflux transporter MFP subunit [Roseiarcus fermentans]
MRLALCLALAMSAPPPAVAASLVVHASATPDEKAIVATVEPAHELTARARIGGTIASLSVKEGDWVTAGQEIAVIADQKLVLQRQALDSRIQSQQSQRDKARSDYDRALELMRRGVGTQVQVDATRTALDVADRTLSAMGSDRDVLDQQMKEGATLAPGAGRVLKTPGAEGSVVLPGETIATIAENHYILRLQLPERHARVMRAGDVVKIGGRGAAGGGSLSEGKVRIVYPEIEGGRVIADVEAPDVGDYFVGERTRVYVATGDRPAIVVPRAYVHRRAGVDYVKLKDGVEVVVQIGSGDDKTVEILAGLADGDEVVTP